MMVDNFTTCQTTVKMDDTNARVLPPETTDKIIGYLHDTPAALVSSSLVQRTWTARAQWLLYAKMSLRGHQAYASLRCLRFEPSTKTFLQQQCQHTTRLEITDDRDRPYAHAVPLTFSTLLPALTTLVYHAAHWGSLHPDPALLNSLSTFHTVATLEIYGCQFRKFRDFVRIICAFRNLCHLTIARTDLGKPSVHPFEPATTSLGNKLRLSHLCAQHLVSDGTCLAELLNWLSMTPSANPEDPEAKSIQVLMIHPQNLTPGTSFHGPLQALLQLLGSSLTVLDIPVLSEGTGAFCHNCTTSDSETVERSHRHRHSIWSQCEQPSPVARFATYLPRGVGHRVGDHRADTEHDHLPVSANPRACVHDISRHLHQYRGSL